MATDSTKMSAEEMTGILRALGIENDEMEFSDLYKGVASFVHPTNSKVRASVGYASHEAAYELSISAREPLNVHNFNFIQVDDVTWEDEDSYW